MEKAIAVLITCHNRREKTLAGLKALFAAELPESYGIEVFLVDDGSTDGTGEAVKKQFPQVNVIQGTGSLFWNQGMRLAWQTAATARKFDYFLWLNDDTILDKKALIELFECSSEIAKQDKKQAIIVGACRASENSDVFSYGGRNDYGPVIPNGKLQTCKYINGNVVLIPAVIYEVLRNLSPEYTHTLGDYDYGLRAGNAGFHCYTTKTYIATCPPNGSADWCNPKVPLKKRWQLFHSPKGLNIKDYNKFRKKFWRNRWIIFSLKAYLRVIIPSIYNTIRSNNI